MSMFPLKERCITIGICLEPSSDSKYKIKINIFQSDLFIFVLLLLYVKTIKSFKIVLIFHKDCTNFEIAMLVAMV